MTLDIYFHDKERKEMLMVEHNKVGSTRNGDIALHLEEYVSSRESIPEDIARALLRTLNTNFMSAYAENKALARRFAGEDVPEVDRAAAAKQMRDAIARKAGITYTQADLAEDKHYVSLWETKRAEEAAEKAQKPKKSRLASLLGGLF